MAKHNAGKQIVEVYEDKKFQDKDIILYREIFGDIESGYIAEGKFDSNKWIVWVNEDKTNRTTLNFNLKGKLQRMNVIVKSYLLYLMKKGNLTGGSLSEKCRFIVKAIRVTNNFSEDNDSQEAFFGELNAINNLRGFNSDFIYAVSEFFNFYEVENEWIYKEICDENIVYCGEKIRTLPNYASVLALKYIMERVFSLFEIKEKIRYFPLKLWWDITTRIPLRPNEFFKLKYDCCYSDENGRYWLTVPRSKVKDDRAVIKLVYTLEVNKKIYDLIEHYKQMVHTVYNEETEFLFPYKLHHQYLSRNISIDRRLNQERICNGIARRLLDEFYEEVVHVNFPTVKKVRLGDTRHFAFCNMMLMGLDRLTIAQIGGHTKLDSQDHYCPHENYFADSYITTYAREVYEKKDFLIKLSMQNKEKDYETIKIKEIFDGLETLKKIYITIEKGICLKFKRDNEPNFNECPDSCGGCKYHLLDTEKYPEAKKQLQEESNQLSLIINEQIEVIKDLRSSMKINVKQGYTELTAKSKLSALGANLLTLLRKKATMDSNLMDYILNDNTQLDFKGKGDTV